MLVRDDGDDGPPVELDEDAVRQVVGVLLLALPGQHAVVTVTRDGRVVGAVHGDHAVAAVLLTPTNPSTTPPPENGAPTS